MSSEANKALIRKAKEEVFIEGHADAADVYYSAHFVNHSRIPGQAPGIDGIKQLVRETHVAFPGFTYTIDDLIADGDRVVAKGTLTGVHTKAFFGIAPSGQEVTMTAIAIFRIEEGKVVERWAVSTPLELTRSQVVHANCDLDLASGQLPGLIAL